jgi:hypothetical protein
VLHQHPGIAIYLGWPLAQVAIDSSSLASRLSLLPQSPRPLVAHAGTPPGPFVLLCDVRRLYFRFDAACGRCASITLRSAGWVSLKLGVVGTS